MTKPIHETNPDLIAVFTVAKLEGVSYTAARRRALRGRYGEIVRVGGVMCAYRSELVERGIIKDERDLNETPITRDVKALVLAVLRAVLSLPEAEQKLLIAGLAVSARVRFTGFEQLLVEMTGTATRPDDDNDKKNKGQGSGQECIGHRTHG